MRIGEKLRPVGLLIFEQEGNKQGSAFQYYEDWLTSPGSFPISPAMDLSSTWHYRSGVGDHYSDSLLGPIADSTPDAWGRALIEQTAGSQLSELEMLLEVNDHARLGALRFVDENRKLIQPQDSPNTHELSLDSLRFLAQEFELGEGDVKEVARQLRGTADSLGGARPKADFYDKGTLCLAKFTSARDTYPVERMEVAALKLAQTAGVRAASARIALMETSYPVAIVKRFDRVGSSRRHYISARSFLDVQGGMPNHYYTDLVDLMKSQCGDGLRTLNEIHELHRRIVFIILVSNTDDHLKNLGFLYDEQGWGLAPAFDINPQPQRHRQLKTGISAISGNEASIAAAVEAAPFFELSEDEARNEALRLATIIQARWKDHCIDVGMSESDCRYYEGAFNHEQMEIALKFSSRGIAVQSDQESERNATPQDR